MYKNLNFKPKSVEEIKKDVDTAAKIYNGARTVFIADSDSLVMKNIEEVVRYIKQGFPDAERFTSYARARTLMKLGVERLRKIKEAGLTRVHVGLESGDRETLEFMCKGSTPEEMIAGGKVAKKAGLQISFYVLVGAGGAGRSQEHAIESARVCNEVNPDFIRLRTLVVQHGSLLRKEKDSGNYEPTSPIEKLQEVKMLIENLEVNDCEFASDHFANYIWLDNKVIYDGVSGMLPQDKQKMLDTLNHTLDVLNTAEDEVVDATILYERGAIHSL